MYLLFKDVGKNICTAFMWWSMEHVNIPDTLQHHYHIDNEYRNVQQETNIEKSPV